MKETVDGDCSSTKKYSTKFQILPKTLKSNAVNFFLEFNVKQRTNICIHRFVLFYATFQNKMHLVNPHIFFLNGTQKRFSKKISSTVNELDRTKTKLEKSQNDLEEARNDAISFKNQLEDLQMHFNYNVDVVRKYQELFLGKENEEFFSSKEKFPPGVIKKADQLTNLEKWPLFLAVAKFYSQGGSIGGEAVTEMQKLDLAFDRDSREELTPIGRILWKYKNLFAPENSYKVY